MMNLLSGLLGLLPAHLGMLTLRLWSMWIPNINISQGNVETSLKYWWDNLKIGQYLTKLW